MKPIKNKVDRKRRSKMKVTGKNSLSNGIKIGLQFVFILGIMVIVLLPFWLKLYCTYVNTNLVYFPSLILLYASGIPGLIIVKEFIKMFDTLKQNNPFVVENVKHLKICSIWSFLISIEYIIGAFVTKSVFSIIVIGVFIIAWLGLYILSELLKQAIEYKEENELTI